MPGAQGIEVTVSLAGPLPGLVYIEVASRNIPGQDGTLANDYVLSRGQLSQRDSAPSVFTGTIPTVYTPLANARGVYFVQVYGDARCPGLGSCPFMSPVYTWRIGLSPPTPPDPVEQIRTAPSDRLRLADARVYARRWARRRNWRGVRVACIREDASTAVCRVSYERRGARKRTRLQIYRTDGRISVGAVY